MKITPRQSIVRWNACHLRAVLFLGALLCHLLFPAPHAIAAAAKRVVLEPVKVTPEMLSPGQYPAIETTVRVPRDGTTIYEVVNIIVAVTLPDHRVKSWSWNQIKISRGAATPISVPKEYDTSLTGTYRVEVMVYSDDMKHRLAARSQTFDVIDLSTVKKQPAKKVPEKEQRVAETAAEKEPEMHVGLGIYGNALNPAGGGTLLLWPSRYVGVQGIYTIGRFTSYEGRLLVKLKQFQSYGIYGGAGYLHVAKKEDIIGVETEFEDSGVSGVVGAEVRLGKNTLLYVEASAAKIELEKIVTNAGRTVKATVDYAPVTLGVGIVMAIF